MKKQKFILANLDVKSFPTTTKNINDLATIKGGYITVTISIDFPNTQDSPCITQKKAQ